MAQNPWDDEEAGNEDSKELFEPWLVWLSGLSIHLQTKGSLVQFSVRPHAWVAVPVPSIGYARGNHTLMFLSLCFSLPSPLKINNKNKILFKKEPFEKLITFSGI